MKGYVNANVAGDYKLKEIVPFLISDLDKHFSETELFTVTDEPRRYPKTKSQFFESLRDGSLLGGKSSRLHKIFSRIIDSTGKGEVSIIISDCILDIGSQNNITERGKMTYEVYQSLTQKEDFGAAVFQYVSDFNGSFYYDRENTRPMPFSGQILQDRPFYIWILGDADKVKLILGKNILRDYQHACFYGLSEFEINPTILKFPKKGKLIISEEQQTVRVNDLPASFTIGISTENLLGTYRSKSYLQNHIEVDKDYLPVSLTITTLDDIKSNKNYPKIAPLVQEFQLDQFISVSLDRSKNPTETFSIRLPKAEAAWLNETNLEDDLGVTASELEGKTFSLKYLTDAFARQFGSEYIFSFPVTNQSNAR